jgi:hypothetical protein
MVKFSKFIGASYEVEIKAYAETTSIRTSVCV